MPDYSKVFNKLCHFAALTKDGKISAVVDDLVLQVMAVDDSLSPSSAKEVVEALDAYFGLPINEILVQSSLDRHINAHRLVRDRSTKRLRLQGAVNSAIQARIREAELLERRVREEWVGSLNKLGLDLSLSDQDELWKCLRKYMTKAFARHGVETIRLLAPSVSVSGHEPRGLSTYLEESINECCDGITAKQAKESIRLFFRQTTSDRAKYIAQLLDGTFTFFALSLDESTAQYLKSAVPPLRVLLDTNFIFGILDLHVNPLVDVSHELVKLIKTHDLPLRLSYHEETLKEIRRTIKAIGDRMRSQKWQQSVSRAAIRGSQLTGLEFRYHSKNAEAPLDPDVFLSKYDAITEILDSYGFKVFKDQVSDKELETFEKGELIPRYKAFLEQRRPPKPYAALDHDMAVWLAAKRLRSKGDSLLDLGCLFLTADYHLFCFDWQELRNRDSVGIVVMPNSLLQILRPFVPVTDDFNERFAQTFAIPEFRVIGSDYSASYSKVVSYLNTYADMGEELASRILAKSVLIESLKGIDENSPEFKEAVEQAIARDYRELMEEKEVVQAEKLKAQEQVGALAVKVDDIAKCLEETQQQLQSVYSQAKVVQDEKDRIAKEMMDRDKESAEIQADQAKKILELEGKLERERLVRRAALGIALALSGVAAVFLIPWLYDWAWLMNHPHRYGLQGASIVIILSLSWAIFDRKRLIYSLGVLGTGALLVILQLIGR